MRQRKALCLCLDLHYHVLILMQFEKETDKETHWVKRGSSVLSGTVWVHSPHMLPTRKAQAKWIPSLYVVPLPRGFRMMLKCSLWLFMGLEATVGCTPHLYYNVCLKFINSLNFKSACRFYTPCLILMVAYHI